MKKKEHKDLLFEEAVEAIDNGFTAVLKELITKNPRLITQPLDHPTGDYFDNPYLLWFVADNPIRIGKMAANVEEITALLIQAVKQESPETAQKQLDYALGLVATGRIPKECGVQIGMMDLLIDAGASPGHGISALAHGNPGAAAHIIKRGGELTLASAVGLDRMADIDRLLPLADEKERLLALTTASFYGRADLISYLLKNGADPNGYPEKSSGFHSHATPLHQAVFSGSLESVKLLVGAGASTIARDEIFDGTPLGWAEHMSNEEKKDEEAKKKFDQIADYLRKL